MTDLENGVETITRNMDRQLAEVLAKRPALEAVVKPFAAVLTAKAVFVAHLSRELDLDGLEFDISHVTSGAPLISQLSFNRMKSPLNQSFGTLVPALKSSFPPIAADLDRLALSLKQHNFDLVHLADAFMEGNPEFFESQAQHQTVTPGCLEFVGHFTLSAVLQALERHLKSMPGLTGWKEGYCPICGSWPSLGFLGKSSMEGSEFLKGGGGTKYLHCALCGHDWREKRHTCPACHSDDKDLKFYLKVQNEATERVDICRNCGHYLLILDTRQNMRDLHMDLASVGLLHLEIIARQKGYHPMTWTPWNREN